MENVNDIQSNGENDTIRDEIINLKECENEDDIWNENNKMYCPDFTDGDFFYGNYYNAK